MQYLWHAVDNYEENEDDSIYTWNGRRLGFEDSLDSA